MKSIRLGSPEPTKKNPCKRIGDYKIVIAGPWEWTLDYRNRPARLRLSIDEENWTTVDYWRHDSGKWSAWDFEPGEEFFSGECRIRELPSISPRFIRRRLDRLKASERLKRGEALLKGVNSMLGDTQ